MNPHLCMLHSRDHGNRNSMNSRLGCLPPAIMCSVGILLLSDHPKGSPSREEGPKLKSPKRRISCKKRLCGLSER